MILILSLSLYLLFLSLSLSLSLSSPLSLSSSEVCEILSFHKMRANPLHSMKNERQQILWNQRSKIHSFYWYFVFRFGYFCSFLVWMKKEGGIECKVQRQSIYFLVILVIFCFCLRHLDSFLFVCMMRNGRW